jgi:hypothetical protein
MLTTLHSRDPTGIFNRDHYKKVLLILLIPSKYI